MKDLIVLSLAPAAAESPSGWLFLTIAAILAVAAVSLLVLQVMIVRQIGVLHLRLGPEIKTEPPPSSTKLGVVTMDDGTVRRFGDHPKTACLLVSSTCDVCERILEDLSRSRKFGGWIVGLASGSASLEEIRQRFGLPRGILFDGRELARDLKVISVPLFVLLDSSRTVLSRSMADSLESIEGRILATTARVPADSEPTHAGQNSPVSSN